MTDANHPWETRFHLILSTYLWGAWILGAVVSVSSDGINPMTAGAAGAVGAYVVAIQAVPRWLRQAPVTGEMLAVIGIVTSFVAVVLTDGLNSPYIVFAGAPVFFAAALLNTRVGLETALLAIAGVVIAVALLGQPLAFNQLLQAGALYVLIAVTFSQARRILIEERERSDQLERESVEDIIQVERLIAANNLLASLADLADAAELNPVTVGEAALRDLSLVLPFDAGRVFIEGDGTTAAVVAERGRQRTPTHRESFDITIGERAVGRVVLWTPEPLTLNDRAFVNDALRPVALAFDNILLLRSIAHQAVREERVRLARGLHDDIGPALASIGLSIDVALHQFAPSPELAAHLETVRSRLTSLVEDVRRSVADLRADERESVVQRVHAIAAEVDAGDVAMVIELDERRPPHRTVSVELGAIITEAVRNALEHADPSRIEIEGYIDRHEGKLTISDDGRGFDPNTVGRGHFGLIGLKERADMIDATIDVHSAIGVGTSISVQWGRA